MAEKRPIESWGERLNIKGEPLTMEEAKLLHLGHLNARMDLLLTAIQDMQARLTRIELYMQETLPDYERVSRRAALQLMGAQAGVARPIRGSE